MHIFPTLFFLILMFASDGLAAIARVVPSADCNDNVENPRFYENACSDDARCFGSPYSMTCKDGKCQCVEGYLPEDRFVGEQGVQKVCTRAPSLFTKCNTTCQKPGVCLPYTGEGSDGKIKVCQCAQPFQYENGICYLSCKKDEYYETSKYKCIKRCQQNEVRINDTCLALVDLNGKCQSSVQCQSPYSECKSNLCTCKSGFTVDNGICSPQVISCPSGEPLKKGNKFVSCHTVRSAVDNDDSSDDNATAPSPPPLSPVKGIGVPPPPIGGRKRKSDCPEGSYCLVPPGGDYYSRPSSTGFCCPIRPPACPVGLPHPTAKCGASSPREQACPWESHFCQAQTATADSEISLCCPKTCADGFLRVNDKCLPRVRLGDACSSKDQCSDSNTDCIGGVCQCQSGAKVINSLSYRYCSIECADDEVLQDNKCQKRLKLADTCNQKKSFLCPAYGRCSLKNQCVCQCGAFTLVDNVCAPPPICRPPIVFPFPMFASERGMAGAPPPPPPIPRISDEEREKLLKNTTFCKVKDKSPPVGLKVASCPGSQYCSSYITNVGICCDKPEPLCPMGGQPKKGSVCDPKNPLSCGLESTCVKYLSPVDQDENSKDYTVCCSRFNSGPHSRIAKEK